MKAWAKICGLDASELCANERLFLASIDYDLFVPQHTWARWTGTINRRVEVVRERRERERTNRSKVAGWLRAVGNEAVCPTLGAPPSPPCMEVPMRFPIAGGAKAGAADASRDSIAAGAPLTPPQEELRDARAMAVPTLVAHPPLSRKRGWNSLPSPESETTDGEPVTKRFRMGCT